MRVALVLPAALFGVLALAFAAFMILGRDPRLLPSTMIDQPVPAFTLPALRTGEPGLASADLNAGAGVKLVNFFASWCVPCRVEQPVLMRFAREGGAPIFGINYKDKPEDAIKWLKELGDPFARVAADRDGRAAIDWGVYGIPETFVIDPAGRIRYRHAGPITQDVLERNLMPVIKEAAK
ncbi:MAG: DsbE family thiol:disulfide interchange protein [Proteobacteria bacterium]|nr:DsbE family thiol:disulfide interchange protein [Pseudomonadota bacterium]